MAFCSLNLFLSNQELVLKPCKEEIELDDEVPKCTIFCEYCGKEFKKKSKMQIHINETHLNIKDFKCEICNKDFKRKQHLKRHLLSHTQERPYKCHIENCPQSFTCKHHLKRHINLIHEQKKIFNCGQCSFSTLKKKQLNKHISDNHENKKQDKLNVTLFQCDCGKSFTRLRNLRKHKAVVHEKRRDFECEQCGKQFAHKCTLSKHLQNKHQQQ